jgi:hypothetical protein
MRALAGRMAETAAKGATGKETATVPAASEQAARMGATSALEG